MRSDIHLAALTMQALMLNCRNHIITVLAVSTVLSCSAHAQTYPQDFDYSTYTDIMLDVGYIWDINSTYHPLSAKLSSDSIDYASYSWIRSYLQAYSRFDSLQSHMTPRELGLVMIPALGFSAQNGVNVDFHHVAFQEMLWTSARYGDWYYRLLVRATNEPESLPHYTGLSRSIARASLRAAEIDQSVAGYSNDWATVEWGRTREIWGSMSGDNLLLAGNSPAYERLMLELRYRRLSYRWFYGFLEGITAPGNEHIQRYLIGKSLEYRNRKNLVVSIGEVSVLAGPDRSPDWAFLNPFSVHLEIESNKRENETRRNRSNFILFANVDWLPTPDLRLSGSIALDEFQLDAENRNNGDADALGWMGRIAWTPIRKPIGATVYAQYVKVDTYTLQHVYGYTNMVTRGELISHPVGNDADEVKLGTRVVLPYPIVVDIAAGRNRWGSNSLIDNPYSGYTTFKELPFPSGEVRENSFVSLSLLAIPVRNIHFSIESHIDLAHSGTNSSRERHTVSLRYQLPILWRGGT